MHYLEADSVGLCETSVNWSNNKTKQYYSNLLQRKYSKSNLVVSRLLKNPSTIHLPGGCASVTIEKLVSKIESNIDDRYNMGKWSGVKYRINKAKRLNVITAYRVIDQPVTANNSLSSNSQHYHTMLNCGIDTVKPRRHFITDICKEFEEMCHEHDQITLLIINANECISTPEKDGIQI
jgi:hypothetical protein